MEKVLNTESPEFVSFFEGVRRIYLTYMEKNFPNQVEEMTVKQGPRYIKINRGNSVHAFVDRTNGDVLKPASWRAPAKTARGNVFDDKNGLGMINHYGPEYLR